MDIASQSRARDLDNFFAVLLSEYGKLCGATKPDFHDCLESISKPTYIKPKIDAIIIDGPAFVQMIHSEPSLKTFGSYCKVQLVNKVNSFCQNANPINFVFDVYQENSSKNDGRRDNREGTRTLVRHDTPIQHNKFRDF